MRLGGAGLMLLAGTIAVSAGAQTKTTVAATPPMGWNSWDAYGLTITEAQFRDNVEVLAERLKPYGWTYAVIDEGWFFENPEDRPKPEMLRYAIDGNGRFVPVPSRFPSVVVEGVAAPAISHEAGRQPATIEETSFAELARSVHAQGLKFGIHIVRGIPRVAVERNLPIAGSSFHAQDAADTKDACPWDPTNWGVKDNAAGQAWYDSLLQQYAAWGVDLLKVDCIADHPYKADEIAMIRRAIDKAGRPMVLSLSPGPTQLEVAAEIGSKAQMWRISEDVWDYWVNPKPFPQSVSNQFARVAAWAKYAKHGNWPDADMLPLGELRPAPGHGEPRKSRLTPDEQRTLVTLWAMARSPLILGANLTLLDANTMRLLANKDVIRVDQGSKGSRLVRRDGNVIAWTSDLADGSKALALFNVDDVHVDVKSDFAVYGLPGKSYQVKNAWSGAELGAKKTVRVGIEPHACVLWILKK